MALACYTSNIHLCSQDFNTRIFDDDIPSAPPFAGSIHEHNQVAEQHTNSETDVKSISGISRGSATTGDPITCTSTLRDTTKSRVNESSGRYLCQACLPLFLM